MKRHKKPVEYWILRLIILLAILAGFRTCEVVNGSEADTQISDEYVQYCEEIGEEYGICPELLEAIIETESAGDSDAVGAAGDSGLMQVVPKWHRKRMDKLHVGDIFNPYGNIRVGADYLAEMAEQYEDIAVVLMVYNGISPEDAKRMAQQGHITDYADKVLRRAAQLEKLHGK